MEKNIFNDDEFDNNYYDEFDDDFSSEEIEEIVKNYDPSLIDQDEVEEALRKIEEIERQEELEKELFIKKYGYKVVENDSLEDDAYEICKQIQEERLIQDEILSNMTEPERLDQYRKICKEASDYAKQHNIKTITANEIKNNKL